MAWNFVEQLNTGNAGGTSLTTGNFTKAVASGDLLAVIIGEQTNLATVTSITDSVGGNTYTLANSFGNLAGGRIHFYYCTVTNGGAAMNFTVQMSNSVYTFAVLHYTGNAATPFDAVTGSVITSAPGVTSLTLTVSNANELIVAAASTLSANTFTVGSGWTERVNTALNFQEVLQVQDKFDISANLSSFWTESASGDKVPCGLFGFKKGAAVVTPAPVAPWFLFFDDF